MSSTNNENNKITSFTDLDAWKLGHKLATVIYKATDSFPSTEQFGLTNQMRRCAVSVTSNIAEGFSRQTKKDKTHFYSIALGSTTELQNQLLLARDLHFLKEDNFKKIADKTVDVHKLINGLIKSAQTKGNT